MDSGLYLIHKDDYIAHIDDKTDMYDLLLFMAQEAREQIAAGQTAEALRVLVRCEQEAIEAFETWGIPESYIESGDEDELNELMENELLPPEDSGDSMEEWEGDETSVPAELLELTKSLTEAAKQTLRLYDRVMADCFDL